jgi:hypothetical protein
MVLMGRWIHHHATSTVVVDAEFGEWADFLFDSIKASNDVKVHWLRPQTHMEWFPHPLNTYTIHFRPFIWC